MVFKLSFWIIVGFVGVDWIALFASGCLLLKWLCVSVFDSWVDLGRAGASGVFGFCLLLVIRFGVC